MIKSGNNFFEYKYIGEFSSNGDWIHPERVIDSFEIIFVISGIVYIEEEGNKYELSPNEFIILEPGKIHKGYKISEASFYWFHFDTDMELPCKICKSGEYYDIKYLLKKLLHVSNTPTYLQNTADTLGLLIFQEAVFLNNSAVGMENALVNKIAEYVKINMISNITVSKIAKHFGYNTDYISRLFKKSFNIGLKQYIYSERIKMAKDLLLTTNLSVKEIAANLGFVDENLFVKFFIYHEEISPSKFRNKYYNTHMNNK